GVGGSNDASKGQQVAIRAYCFELLIANSCDRPVSSLGCQSAFLPCKKRSGKNMVIVFPYGLHPPSYNAWSSSCAFYPPLVPSSRLAWKFSSHRSENKEENRVHMNAVDDLDYRENRGPHWGIRVALWLSIGVGKRRRNCLHNYAPIKRTGYRRQKRKGERERRIGAEWLMRATAISIPAQLRLARKERNLIRSSCSLILPDSHEEAKHSADETDT
ncbi:hypothetical protein ALC53_07150, partial [Atta colombica]